MTRFDETSGRALNTWTRQRVRIVAHTAGPLAAGGIDVAMEELTLAYERLSIE